ncbi:glutamine synthetase family protein [Streptomyces sp. ME01-24h]|nr:glutamine synthetase family protein [Streptomyces sp. ME19-03-3]MDX3356084.1 glutamine synthetase family protein [Streptomyces sp. ME01-24h]
METEERDERRLTARREAARLSAEGVRAVALSWVDNAGISRAKTVPTVRLPHAADRGVGMSPVFDVFTSDDACTSSPLIAGPDGDLRLFPDLTRLTVLAARPGWAWAPADRYEQDGRPYPGCQRLFARRMTRRAAARGLELRMGFETEWIVVKDDGSGDWACRGPAYGMTRVTELSDYLLDLHDALAAQRVEVLQVHPEYAPGQFEVSTAPADPVRAADEVVLVRETVRAVSAAHDLRASFAPAVVAGQVGNGCHLHLSLREHGRNLHRDRTAPYGLAPAASTFLAGVLDALPALCAIGAPSPASYLRLAPSRWAGAYRCWGVENREAALRLVPGEADDPDGGHAELKPFDAAANPYLLAGSVIAAGLAAARDEGGAPALPPAVSGDPAARGDQERLPTTLGEAVGHLVRSDVLREALGEALFGAVVAVRRAESQALAGYGPAELVEATRWRW